MVFGFSNRKLGLSPNADELKGLASETARFKSSDLYGRLQSQGGDYLSTPVPSDRKAAAELMNQIGPGETRKLIGRLESCAEGFGLFFRGKKIDTLEPESAKAFGQKVQSGAWVIFELTHVISRDGKRTWPSLAIKPGRTID